MKKYAPFVLIILISNYVTAQYNNMTMPEAYYGSNGTDGISLI